MPSPIPRSPSLKQRSRSWVRFLKPWNQPFSGRSRSRPPRKVWLEPLEPRMLLSGDGWPLPVITALADAAEVLEIQLEDISNDVTFQIDGDAVIVFNNMKPDDTGTSYDLEGQTQVHITGTEDDDIIHLDIVNSPAGLSILLDAGGGEDRLVLAGGTFDSAAYEADGADSGSIDLDGLLIKYTGLEPITDNTNAVDRIFTVNIAGDQIIQLGDDGDATNGQSIIQGGEGTLFESITFNHPTGSLTIHAGDGDDEIRIGPLEDSFGASIQVNGGDGADRLTIDADGGTPVFGTGQVTVNGVDILYQTDTEDIEIHNVSLNAPDRQAILDSLRDLATAAGIEKLGKAGDLAQELPLTDNTLGELIDAGAVLQKLHDDVEDFFEDPANATTKQFIDFLKSWNVTLTGDDLSQVELGDIVVTVDPDAIGVSILTTSETGAPKELAIRVKFSTNRVSPYDFAPPLDSSSGDGRDPSALVGLADVDELVERGIIVLSDSGSVTTFDLETGFDFDAIFGNEYGVADTNFAVLDAGGFVARAGFDNTADTGGQIDAEVRIGFLGAGITGGTVVYSAVAPIQMTDRDGDGRLSAVELSNLATQTDPVAAVDGTGTLSVTLPVTVRAGFQSGSEPDPRGESLTIHELGGDFFASGVITSIPEELNDFTTLEAPNVLSSIVEIGEWLTKISQSDYFQAVVPFLKDIDLRDAIDFGRLFNDTLTDAIQYTPDPSQPKELAPRFDTAQELAAKLEEGLAAVMDNPVVEAVYDSATHRLSYRLTFGGEFDELFPVLTAANDISALQGRLSGDATFNVILNGVDSRAVTLPASSTSDNTTLADLVDDVHRALFEAGLAFDPDSGSTGDGTGKLVAELDNGRLILRAIDPSIKTLRVTASNGSNTAVTELGLATDQSTTSKIARASFTLESGALQDLRTFSTFDVSAEGNIDMTLGFDLVPNLTPTLGSGLYDESVYAGEDYDTAESIIPDTGELSGDAVFTLIIDEQSYVILVSANDTAGNDAEPTGKNARLESAERPLVFFNEGRLVQDATFQLSVTNKNTSSPATDVITLRSDDTDDNESMEDLKSDLEAVLADSGLSGLVLVGIEDGRLVLEAAHPDIEEIQLTAVEQLTLPEAAITKSNGNPTGADFQILRPDETPVAISVTGAGWDALKDAINTQIGMNPSLNGLSAKLETAHGSTYIVVEGALDFTVKAGSLEVEAQNPVFREMGFTQNQTGSLYRDPGDALALDVQEAIEAALGASRIECVHIGGRILLHAKSESGITFLKFGETNAVAENELGFRAGESSRAVSTKFYLQDVVLAAGLEFTADDIDAVGRYGFLGIETEDGEGEVTAEVTFTLDGLLYKSNPDSLLHETNLPAGDLDILLDQFLGNELDKDAVLGELDPGALDAGRVDVNRLRFAPDSSHEGLYVDAAALDHLLESVGLTRQSFESHVGGDVDPAWGLYELLDRLNDQQANGQLLSLSEFLNCIRIPFEDFLDGIGADLSDYLAHFNTEGLNFKGFMEALGLTTPAGFFKAVDLTKLGLLEFIADQGLDRLALADIDLLGLGEVMDSTDQPLGAQLFKILQQSGGIHSEISSSASVALNRVTAVDGFVALQSTGGSSPETGLTLRMEYDHWIRDPLGATSVPDAVTLSPAGNTTAGDYAVLTQFENASFGAVLEGLKAAADYLEELGQDASLDAHLPLLNAGVNDLFHYTDRFRSAVQNLASHPAATVQALEAALKEAFGLPADSPKIGVVLDTDSVNGNALRVDLEYFTESVDALRLNLDVPTLLDLADPDPILEENLENIQILQASNSAGNLTVSLQATYELMLGIGLTGPQAQNPFLYRSGNNNQKTQFRIDARAQASNMDFTLQTGPLGLIVVDGEAELDGSFQFELTGGPERHGLDSLETLVEHTESRVTGGASATLPLFYPTEHNPLDAIIGPDGTIVPEGNHLLIVEIEDLEPFLEGAYGAGNVNLKSPDIRTRFDELDLRNYLLDPDGLISSLDALLETLQDALNTQVYSRGLPLIGDNLTGPGQILESFREDLLTGIYLSILGATPDQAIERVQEALFAVLGTDHGLLVDSDGNPAPDKDAIQVTAITNESGTLLNVEFGLHLQGTVEVVVPEGFDTVLPALGLTLDADMQVTLEWEFDFLFGVDLFDGFYLDTSSEEELRIAFHVVFADDHSLANPAEGFLNYLQVEAVDGYLSPNYNEDPQDPAANFKPADETPTHLTGRYEINFLDPDGEVSGGGPDDGDRMTFDEFTSPATLPEDLVSATVSGRADINLFIHVGFGENANFPSLYADFELDWTFDAVEIKPPVNQFGTTIGSQLEYLNYGDSDDFRVSYLNVKLDLGEFITQYVAPILGFVEDVFDPMAWLIDPQKGFLFKKDPIMSFLTGKRYTMLDSISTFYSGAKNMKPFLEAISYVYGLSKMMGQFEAGLGNAYLRLGSLQMPDVRGMLYLPNIIGATPEAEALPEAGSVNLPQLSVFGGLTLEGGTYDNPEFQVTNATFYPTTEWNTQIQGAYDQINANEAARKDGGIGPVTTKDPTGLKKSVSGGASAGMDFLLDFPLLTNPLEALKLLTGEHPTLFLLDLPTFSFDVNISVEFVFWVPPKVAAGVYGGLGADIKVGFGYDTLGLEKFSRSGDKGDIWDGFFINDIDYFTGRDRPELTLRGFVNIEANVDAGFVKVGGGGGITGTVYFNLNDPDHDGKVRINEMEANWKQGFDFLFDISGLIKWNLYLYVDVMGIRAATFDIVSGVIYTFDLSANRPPVLAADIGDGVLRLNMGEYAAERIHGNVTDGDEIFKVSATATDAAAGTQTIRVEYNGNVQSYSHVKKVVADGGEGNDQIIVDASVILPTILYGGNGDDILYGGSGVDEIYGGAGADKLWGRKGDDFLDGGTGPDELHGEEGADTLYGGFGDDHLFGGDGDDVLRGMFGNDIMAGEAGDDMYVFENGWGNDTVLEDENPGVPVTGVSEGEGGRIRITADGHGLNTGDRVVLRGITGTGGNGSLDGANGIFTITKVDENSFDLDGTVFHGGDVVYEGNGKLYSPLNDSTDTWDFSLVRTGLVITLDDGRTVAQDQLNGHTVTHEGFGIEYFLGGRGRDIFNIHESSLVNRTTFDGQRGSDDFLVFLGPNLGRLTTMDSGPIYNRDRLFVFGTEEDDTVGLTDIGYDPDTGGALPSDQFQTDALYVMRFGPAAELVYDSGGEGLGLEIATIELKGGNDTLNVESTPATISVTGKGESGDDEFNIGAVVGASGEFVEEGTLNKIGGTLIKGPVLLLGGGGYDRLNVYDTADSEDNNEANGAAGVMFASEKTELLAGLGMTVGLEYTTVERVHIQLGSGSDELTVFSTLNTAVTTIYAGDGDDRITVSEADSTNDGPLAIYGEGGTDTIDATGSELPLYLDGQEDDDTITGGSGDDTIVGGLGDDRVDGGPGQDRIWGDSSLDLTITRNDTSSYNNDLTLVVTKKETGGNDELHGGAGGDWIFGELGDDTVFGDEGEDVLFGDYGELDGANTRQGMSTITVIETTNPTLGGKDTLSGGDDDDILLGGAASDSLKGDAGFDILLGDHGRLVYNRTESEGGDEDPLTLDLIQTIDPEEGGADTITGGTGDDILIGGADGDTMYGNSAESLSEGGLSESAVPESDADILLGDHGVLVHNRGALILLQTTDLDAASGGADLIYGNEDDDIILAGEGGDTVHGGSGEDIILGDNGLFLYENGDADPASLDLIRSTDPLNGGDDTLYGDEGNDLLLGGTGNDWMDGGEDNDLLLGDHGQVYRDVENSRSAIDLTQLPLTEMAELPFYFTSIHTGAAEGAGDDALFGNAGHDILMGQQGSDALFGGSGDDDLTGGHNVSGGHDAGDKMDGGAGDDVLAGDNAVIQRRPDTLNPLIQRLNGETLYKMDPATGYFTEGYEADITGESQPHPNGMAGREITLLDHAIDTDPTRFGDDTLAGGADDDRIFGQLGDDWIQGDGRIDPVSLAFEVFEADTDGDDYIEGNGGADTMYGGLGQDDLLGGSSDLFGLTAPEQRPDGSDTIFGGAGTAISRNHPGDESDEGHARDADMILGDNGRVFRVVEAAGEGTAFLTFNYDTYTGGDGLKIIPRAAEMLDYTPGGAEGDIGSGDQVRGESGDDTIHGMTGNDVLYGDGQDDDLFGESGDDWVFGGTGDDGLLGDDGKIFTSRNGVPEPLHGVAAIREQNIATPGKAHTAVVNPKGELKKSVDLEPFESGGSDVLYGGQGDDSVHGGAGDDALSGAEALEKFYNRPQPNEATVLLYDEETGEFFNFDDKTPLQGAAPNPDGDPKAFDGEDFFLDFEAGADGADADDGRDALFGGLGNDWLAGGTNRDHLYGGLGNDLLDADDNGATSVTDERADDLYADTAFGGGGRDTLIGNTGADRLVDWVGEFNAFLVPFSPFGGFTITRSPSPNLEEFLYELAESDGADQTRRSTGRDAAERHGEPFGELGLVKQSDAIWQEQTGGPADPQAGNEPGQKKDKK